MIELGAWGGKLLLFVLSRWLRWVILRLMLLSVLAVIVYSFVPPPLTPLMVLRWTENEYAIKKDWIRLDEVSPHVVSAVIASEDQRFLRHFGFDFQEIWSVLRTDGQRRGASTLSQQVAKNVFLWPGRSWIRKGLEVWFTAWIELIWSKERIFQVYLNVAEMGPGIYGFEAASNQYFNKPCAKLNRYESAMLAATLPAPLKHNPARTSSTLLNRQSHILRTMRGLDPSLYGELIMPKATP